MLQMKNQISPTCSSNAFPISGRLVFNWLSFILYLPDKLTTIGNGFSQVVANLSADNAPVQSRY